MRIQIKPTTVQTETGSAVCTEAEVSVALSNSVAIRVVPVDGSGTEHPEAFTGVVGTPEMDAAIADYVSSVTALTEALVNAKM